MQTFVVTVCQEVEAVTITGTTFLLTRQTGVYTASYAPPDATPPVSLTWSNGAVSATTSYSWTWPGMYSVTVTATNLCGQISATLAVTVCQPVEDIAVAGPPVLLPGETGVYTASALPLTTTLPVSFTWSNGAISATTRYSWTVPGLYSFTVTATSACGQVSRTVDIVVCTAVSEVAVTGPASLLVGEVGTFTATYAPPDTTPPVTIVWDNGAVGATANYSWLSPGDYVLTATVTSYCGQAAGTATVEVSRPVYQIYLPLVLRNR